MKIMSADRVRVGDVVILARRRRGVIQAETLPVGTVRLSLADGAHLEMAPTAPLRVKRPSGTAVTAAQRPYDSWSGPGYRGSPRSRTRPAEGAA